MVDRTCQKCGKVFDKPYYLRRHLERKNSCDPIIDGTKSDTTCRYCGRNFASKGSMSRHIVNYCKIANSDEGMEKLMDHTLQRQLAMQQAQLAEQNAKIDKLTSLMEKMVTTGTVPATNNTTMINSNNNNNNITQINIYPWDGDNRIGTTAEKITAAFIENERLKEYLSLDDTQRTDPAIAPPYVETFLADQTRRAHEDPAARNVYLNPKRADQAMVFVKNGHWEVLPLNEVIRGLNDRLMKAVKQIARTPEELRKMTLDVQNAIGLIGMLYDDDPEEYVKRLKASATAHLETLALLGKTSPGGK